MTDRDRLIELIRQAEECPPEYDGEERDTASIYHCEGCQYQEATDCVAERVADYLLANGVIVPPCDIGQTVYTRYGYSFKIQRIEVLEDKKIIFRCGNDGTDDYMAFYDFEIGTDVFLTKEEAEEKLRELNDNA